MVRLWTDLWRDHVCDDTCVLLREWNADWNALAELIWRVQPSDVSPTILVFGYSWGGASAMRFARQLRRRGLWVNCMVLSDPIYRHWYPLGNWRALVPWSRIVVPWNVKAVSWFRQITSWPRGHQLVAEDPKSTAIHEPHICDVAHAYMDDHALFHEHAKIVAGEGK